MAQIHGHEVLNMILNNEGHYTEETLLQAIEHKFGAEVRFCTCSGENMTAQALLAFLKDKGKFVISNGKLATSKDRICDH